MGDAVAERRATARSNSFFLPLLSGALLALSFPKFGHPAVGWLALTPLLVYLAALSGHPARSSRGFLAGLICGAVYFAGTVYWTGGVMARYGGISLPLAVAIAGLLIAVLALFTALFGAAQATLVGRFGLRALLLAPAVWVTAELARTWVLGGFPWVLLGYSQTTVLPIAQLASVVGVYGLSAFVAYAGAAFALAFVGRGRERWVHLAIAAAAVAVCAAWGDARVAGARLVEHGTRVRVGLIQGNVPQDRKWDPEFSSQILSSYLDASRQAADRGARLIIWPESATPFYYQRGPQAAAIRFLARERQVWILLGSDELDPGQPGVSYNSAFLIRPDGSTAGVYRKVRLVPFGEYVPFKSLLFFAEPLVEAVSDFAPGTAPVMLPFAGGAVSTAICYEVVYPALIREGVLQGSTLLTTITNDAWFGRSSAPYQHFAMAAMRAIEHGRYLARSANTGISGIVDPYGRVLISSELFVQRVLVGDIRLLEHRTIYTQVGDVVAYASVLVTLAGLVTAWSAGRRRSWRAPVSTASL
jgi:apolipoprotein N-acyltransferase